MLKKIFFISLFLFLVALTFWGIYNFAFKPSKDTAQTRIAAEPKDSSKGGIFDKKEEPKKEEERIEAVTEEKALGPVIREDETLWYYAFPKGQVFEIPLEGGGKRTISGTEISGLEEIFWSPNHDQVITAANREGKKSFFFYDYASQSGKPLAEGIANLTWSNLGDRIIYLYVNPENGKKSLSVANPDGANWKNLAETSLKNIEIESVPQSADISFWSAPDSLEETTLMTMSIIDGQTKKIFSGRFGADYLWSPRGNKALVSSVESKGGSQMNLGTINSNGEEFQNLGIPTLVSKCVWSKDGKTIYCALPGTVPENVVMPNDYLKGGFLTRDTFWKIDTADGKKERIVELEEIKKEYDASNLFLSPDEDFLFFINRVDGRIYKIKLF